MNYTERNNFRQATDQMSFFILKISNLCYDQNTSWTEVYSRREIGKGSVKNAYTEVKVLISSFRECLGLVAHLEFQDQMVNLWVNRKIKHCMYGKRQTRD